MPDLIHSDLRIKGQVRIVTRDVWDGRVLRDTGFMPNQITNGGASAIVAWLTSTPNRGASASTILWPSHMELGDGTGTPAPTDTDLFSPNATTLVAVTQAGPTPGNPLVAEWTGVWGSNYGPYNATELGLKNAAGTLFAHTMASIDLTSGTTTSVLWQWTLSV